MLFMKRDTCFSLQELSVPEVQTANLKKQFEYSTNIGASRLM